MPRHAPRVHPAYPAEVISNVDSESEMVAVMSLAAVSLSVVKAEPHCPGNVNSLPLRRVQSSQIVVPVTINHAGPFDFMVEDRKSVV